MVDVGNQGKCTTHVHVNLCWRHNVQAVEQSTYLPREIIINHVCDIFDIQPPGSNVSSDHDWALSSAELLEDCFSLRLLLKIT